jgi:hypothetical protein
VVCLITYPWETLLVAAALYVAMIPVSVVQYYKYKRFAQQETEKAESQN